MLVDASSATTYPFASSGIWGDLQGAVEIKGLVKRLCRAPPGRKGYRKGWLRTEKVAGSSPAERAKEIPAKARPTALCSDIGPCCIMEHRCFFRRAGQEDKGRRQVRRSKEQSR